MDLRNQKDADVRGNGRANGRLGTPAENNGNSMYDEFTEFLTQVYWEEYAEQLAAENPKAFQRAYRDFLNAYNL